MIENLPSDATILAWARLVKAQGVVLKAVEVDLRTAGFPPLAWYDVLLELRRTGDGSLRPLEIEGKLLLAQHNVSRLLDRIEGAKLVTRKPCREDGRGQIVVITQAGRELLRRMWPTYRASIQRNIGARLDGIKDTEILAELLGKLLQADGKSKS